MEREVRTMANITEAKMDTEVLRTRDFILGGKAEFTIENTNSGNNFKYKVYNKDDGEIFFVYVDDGSGYKYAGFLKDFGEGLVYRRGAKGNFEANTPAIRGIIYALNKGNNPLPRPMILMHHGRCACCGKRLTDAESVSRGFGSYCWNKVMKGGK